MTPEQIKNWRSILGAQIGPYAFIMPDEEVEAIRDKMQSDIDRLVREEEEKETKK